MEVSEGSETSEDGRRKGRKTVGEKLCIKRGMKESKMEMRGNEGSVEREDRPSNTSDGREVREL